MNMRHIILENAPDNWDQNQRNQSSWSNTYEVTENSQEYKQLKYEIQEALNGNSLKTQIVKIERYQNIHDYGQILCREQLLLAINEHIPLYRVRRFLVIRSHYLQTALQYNADHRRIGLNGLNFQRHVSLSDGQVLLVVQVLTTDPNTNYITPANTSEYFIEYIVTF